MLVEEREEGEGRGGTDLVGGGFLARVGIGELDLRSKGMEVQESLCKVLGIREVLAQSSQFRCLYLLISTSLVCGGGGLTSKGSRPG